MSLARKPTIGRATTGIASSALPCRPRCRPFRSITKTKRKRRAARRRPNSGRKPEMSAYRFEGGCHCGNLSFVFEASAGLDVIGLRADQCTFCLAHRNRTTSDPKGAMRIVVREPSELSRYRFGLGITDFLICKRCGVFIGALMEE